MSRLGCRLDVLFDAFRYFIIIDQFYDVLNTQSLKSLRKKRCGLILFKRFNFVFVFGGENDEFDKIHLLDLNESGETMSDTLTKRVIRINHIHKYN